MIVCDGGSAGKYNYPCQIGKKKKTTTPTTFGRCGELSDPSRGPNLSHHQTVLCLSFLFVCSVVVYILVISNIVSKAQERSQMRSNLKHVLHRDFSYSYKTFLYKVMLVLNIDAGDFCLWMLS